MTIPNILTLLRFLLVPCFLFVSMGGHYAAAFFIFVTAAVTDIVDGWIARRFNQRSRLGAILDPAADKTMWVCGYLFYTIYPAVPVRIPGWLTFVILIRDVLIVLVAYLLYTRIRVKKFPPSVAGKASTVVQAITLAATIGVNAFQPSLASVLSILFKVALAATLVSGFDYLRRGEVLLQDGIDRRAEVT